ncbi:hypothetical protein KFK09_009582 [Dendrobium nobile]|uniref:Uncharacterized protein n=1 Tax=Dendrobium nobile TaxID=94219 RepID=A0A8T3BHJ2_DENNO|nr:hypothetical protein KFK09_009582 [Dendrobium nobile]
MEAVPAGVEPVQWCQLVNKWSEPQDKQEMRKMQKKQKCPHTMGRVSCIRRQEETIACYYGKINRKRKDGSWSSEEAGQKWLHACEMLAEEGLTLEDGNFEANEKVFKIIMGPEHPGRVRTQSFGVTPSRYFPHSTTTPDSSSGSNIALERVVILEEVVQTLQSEDNLSFPLICQDWNADEEILLLEKCMGWETGLNWLSMLIRRIKKQCINHYTALYMNSPSYPLPDMSRVNGKNRKELLAMAKAQGEGKKGL